ncbi:MAG: YeeE/YedE family protein [Pigmentiphaga sp.]|nr:YeeE/YedE family protein [Pigmentiphaga sp.]
MLTPAEIVLWGGLAIGLLFGAVGQASGFCLHRGLHDAWTKQGLAKLRSVALALAVAILGTQAAVAWGMLDLSSAIYTTPTFSWLLVPLGGVLFGLGMTLANGCGARALVLLGEGNLRSLVVLLCLGLAGYATLTGVLAPLRQLVAELTSWSPGVWGLPVTTAYQIVAGLGVLALLVFVFWRGGVWRHPKDAVAGVLIGALVVAGWIVTGVLAADDFDPAPLASLTFVAPIGESLQYLMIATGMSLGFGGAVVFGTLAGSLATALLRREFTWRSFDSPRHMLRSIFGGVAMGVGGALALGCSIGQGLTGMSTLALCSVLATAGIVLGARLGLLLPYRAQA